MDCTILKRQSAEAKRAVPSDGSLSDRASMRAMQWMGLNTEMYQALERVSTKRYLQSTTLPTMLGGGTDMAQQRIKGIQSYGIGPAATDDDTLKFGAHRDAERLLESSLHGLVDFTWRAIIEFAGIR